MVNLNIFFFYMKKSGVMVLTKKKLFLLSAKILLLNVCKPDEGDGVAVFISFVDMLTVISTVDQWCLVINITQFIPFQLLMLNRQLCW